MAIPFLPLAVILQSVQVSGDGAIVDDSKSADYARSLDVVAEVPDAFGRVSAYYLAGTKIVALAFGEVFRQAAGGVPVVVRGTNVARLVSLSAGAPYYVDNGDLSYTWEINDLAANDDVRVGDHIDVVDYRDLIEANANHMLVTAVDTTPAAMTVTATAPGALVAGPSDAAWSDGAVRVGAPLSTICKHTEDSFIAATFFSTILLKRYTGVQSGEIVEAEAISILNAAPYSLTKINRIIAAPNGGYLLFASTAISNKIVKLSPGLAVDKQIIFGSGGAFTDVAVAGDMGVCIGWAPTGAAHQVKVIDPDTLETLATLTLSGGFDMVKGIRQSRGRFMALIQTGRAAEQYYFLGNPDEDEFDWAVAEWATDYSFVANHAGGTNGPPVAYWA